jgi:hypothetical protein
VSSPAAVGRPNPALIPLTATQQWLRSFAGDELRKDGGNGDRPGSLRRTNGRQHRAPNLGIRSVSRKPQESRPEEALG